MGIHGLGRWIIFYVCNLLLPGIFIAGIMTILRYRPTWWELFHLRKAWWMEHTGKHLAARYEAEEPVLRDQIKIRKLNTYPASIGYPEEDQYLYTRTNWSLLMLRYPQYQAANALDSNTTDWIWWAEYVPFTSNPHSMCNQVHPAVIQALMRLAERLITEKALIVDYPQFRVESSGTNGISYAHIIAKVQEDRS